MRISSFFTYLLRVQSIVVLAFWRFLLTVPNLRFGRTRGRLWTQYPVILLQAEYL
jgi:hypothetical protein